MTRGWQFSTSIEVRVTSLGWFDQGGDGLANSHDVRIWSNTGQALMSATVPAGTGASLDSGFRFTGAIGGETLLPPGTYVIGGLSTMNDPVFALVPASQTVTAPPVQFIEERVSLTPGLNFPDFASGVNNGTFGPSFRFVPEPSLGALGVGALILSGRRSRRACP